MLREIEWRHVYRPGDSNLLENFYVPALMVANQYDRAVGFFSSSVLASAAQGVSSLVKNGGKMRLIIGHPLDDEEYQAISQGRSLHDIGIRPYDAFIGMLDRSNTLTSYRLEVLCWMVACGTLDIKFAFRRKGMYHEKIGVIGDAGGDRLIFEGSANETMNALSGDLNAESISVYPSWDEKLYEFYGEPYEKGFEQIWANQQMNTVCISLPSEDYERIAENAIKRAKPELDIEVELEEQIGLSPTFFGAKSFPKIPQSIYGKPFEIKAHQRKALERWAASDYVGILELATGAGKTITAIYGAVRVFEATNPRRLFLIIAVPYIGLADQWIENLRLFGIDAHRCYGGRNQWYDRLKSDVLAFTSRSVDFCALVVVNATLVSSTFKELIDLVPDQRILVIGDECHHHGAAETYSALPAAGMRLGLSATPFRREDDEIDAPFPDEAKNRILYYYGGIVAEYSLGDAINDDILTPYNYFVHPINLSESEQEQYAELSYEIAALLSAKGGTNRDQQKLTRLCGKRSRLLGSAEEKLDVLLNLAGDIPEESRHHVLFYCGEGYVTDAENETKRQISRVSEVLSELGWRTAQFTASESPSERREILSAFLDGAIQGLVSMKVLDEGIDIPACNTAFILASTRNPRQYIQRRGRILRRFRGKTVANIHDFVVLPYSDSDGTARRLKEAELDRVYNFMRLAKNKSAIMNRLQDIGLIS